jgi:ribonuclease Z
MSKIEVTILGTASMIPTKERNLTSVFLSYGEKGILFDCGEGTQRQMKFAGLKPSKISKILISHWHGDHVLGIPGLLQTMGNSDYTKTLEIYGPVGTKKYMEHMLKGFAFDTLLDMEVVEVGEGVIFENDDFYIESYPLSHGVDCVGYSFIEKDQRKINKKKVDKLGISGRAIGELSKGKEIVVHGRKVSPNEVSHIEPGKKVAYVFDTEVCDNALKLAEDADVLLCEATYLSDLEEKGYEYKHMTAKQAALLASNGNVERLVLCHFSARYKTTEELEKEAKDIFPETVCAYDLMKIKL